MRAITTAALALTGIALALNATAGVACDTVQMSLVRLTSTTETSGVAEQPRDVAPGETFLVSGECVADDGDDVHVVLSLSDGAEAKTGFHELMATDQERKDGSLQVRVPNMKETLNHTFRVKLFVGDSNPQICDAGSIRVAATSQTPAG